MTTRMQMNEALKKGNTELYNQLKEQLEKEKGTIDNKEKVLKGLEKIGKEFERH